MGYLRLPDKTEGTKDQEGWLHSGDVGKVDENGFVQITGRIKVRNKKRECTIKKEKEEEKKTHDIPPKKPLCYISFAKKLKFKNGDTVNNEYK